MIHKTIHPKAQEAIHRYFNLPFGRKRVKCPYYMNIKKERAGLRVMVGKGSVAEIVHETKVWAQLKGFNLSRKSEEEIREFMIKKGIGIDCSGFIAHILDHWFKSENRGRVWNNLKFQDNSIYARFRRFLRPIENIGANLLTSDLNCIHIDNFDDIGPGDLIRAKGKQKNAHHVAIITDTHKSESGKLKKFDYVHAHRFYEEENGVRKGTVIISKPEGSLKDQEWRDTYNGKNYMLEDLKVNYEDNGIRRLKALA